jgi:hypothetical protein
MLEEDRNWMAYIDAEVRAVCEAKGWRHQIRRRWSGREKPTSESPIEDYEWKLIPDAAPQPSEEAPSDDFEGVYYVLSVDRPNDRFLFQHDTVHCGVWGSHWEASTYTEIRPTRPMTGTGNQPGATSTYPPVGWLRDHLLALIGRFGPNTFSVT